MTALAIHMNRSVLQASLSEGRFRLFFQAQYTVETRAVAGFEGVVRWNHPELGLLPPGLFMAALVREGFAGAQTCAVAAQAAHAATEWARQGRPAPVAINIGLEEARDPQFPARLEDVVRATGAGPEMLVLEAPEAELARDPIEGFTVLERLQARGFAIALDSRGAGDIPLDGRARALFSGLKCGGPAVVQVARSLGREHHALVGEFAEAQAGLRISSHQLLQAWKRQVEGGRVLDRVKTHLPGAAGKHGCGTKPRPGAMDVAESRR